MDAQNETIQMLKDRAVRKQKYELASELRQLEKDETISSDEKEEKIKYFFEKLSGELEEQENKIIGDTYKIEGDVATSATLLLKDAHALRNEAEIMLVRANEIQNGAFEAIRKAYPQIPNACLSFIHETSSIIVISKPKK